MKKVFDLIVLFVFTVLPFGMNAQQSGKDLKVGDKAPSFSAKDDYGDIWKSDKAIGNEVIVIYFYPAAMTEGCTKQACNYRDNYEDLDEEGVEVIGISGDYPEGLSIFRKANNLNFTLLSDPEGKIARLFGVIVRKGGEVEKEVDGKKVKLKRGVTLDRQTFIIGKDGKIKYINRSVKPEEDTNEVEQVIDKLTGQK